MLGRSPGEVLENYLAPLKESVSCVTTEGLVARQIKPFTERHYALQFNAPVFRLSGDDPIALSIRQRFAVRPQRDHKAVTLVDARLYTGIKSRHRALGLGELLRKLYLERRSLLR